MPNLITSLERRNDATEPSEKPDPDQQDPDITSDGASTESAKVRLARVPYFVWLVLAAVAILVIAGIIQGGDVPTKPGAHVYISGQALNGRTLTCRITVDGVLISENTSSGEYSIATCSGTA